MNNFSAVVKIISDIETVQTKAGALVKARSVHRATYKDDSDIFLGLAFWGKKGEAVQRLLSKGSKIFIRGNLSATTTETGKVFLDVNVDDFDIISNEQQAPKGSKTETKSNKEVVPVSASIEDDDIPF